MFLLAHLTNYKIIHFIVDFSRILKIHVLDALSNFSSYLQGEVLRSLSDIDDLASTFSKVSPLRNYCILQLVR